MASPGDTIFAISSAVGPAARMIVRVTGPSACDIARALRGQIPPGSTAVRTRLHFSDLNCPCSLYCFRAPRSYTGEDLIEVHIPGSPVLARMLLDELARRGGRPAGPGEFTARAYFNGRLDLTRAEGVAATIAARSEQELAAARQLLGGELARRLRPVMDQLAETLALVEAGIDFSEEDVSFLSADQTLRRIRGIDDSLDRLVTESARFERLTHEPTFVLVGRPNAGKSTLLNALAGTSRAVVSDTAGTTRDALSAEIPLDRGLIRMIDVAGLELIPPDPSDRSPRAQIAKQMRARALATIESADFVVLVRDMADPSPAPPLAHDADLIVLTKLDVPPERVGGPPMPPEVISVSAHTGQSMRELRHLLSSLAFGHRAGASTLALNSRHVHAINDARAALARAADMARRETARPELLALELREALDALGQILGQVTPDDVLGRIFSAFCIGK